MTNDTFPTSNNDDQFRVVGSDEQGNPLFTSATNAQFESGLAALNGTTVKPVGPKPPSNVSAVAILPPGFNAN